MNSIDTNLWIDFILFAQRISFFDCIRRKLPHCSVSCPTKLLSFAWHLINSGGNVSCELKSFIDWLFISARSVWSPSKSHLMKFHWSTQSNTMRLPYFINQCTYRMYAHRGQQFPNQWSQPNETEWQTRSFIHDNWWWIIEWIVNYWREFILSIETW